MIFWPEHLEQVNTEQLSKEDSKCLDDTFQFTVPLVASNCMSTWNFGRVSFFNRMPYQVLNYNNNNKDGMQLCMYVRSERKLNSQVDSRMTGSCGTMPFALCRSISFLCNKNIKIAMLLHASCHNPYKGEGRHSPGCSREPQGRQHGRSLCMVGVSKSCGKGYIANCAWCCQRAAIVGFPAEQAWWRQFLKKNANQGSNTALVSISTSSSYKKESIRARYDAKMANRSSILPWFIIWYWRNCCCFQKWISVMLEPYTALNRLTHILGYSNQNVDPCSKTSLI